jgi:hypothetical protein
VSGRHAARSRLDRLQGLGKDLAMKSAISTPDRGSEMVPSTASTDYAGWVDQFESQLRQVAQLARQRNRVAYNLLVDLQATYMATSDQAAQVAVILEQLRGQPGAPR